MENTQNQRVMKVTVIIVRIVFRRVMIAVLIAVLMAMLMAVMVVQMTRALMTAQTLRVRTVEPQPVR